MAVGGLIAVGVLDADILAVAAFGAGLLDHAVAGCEDRGAVAGGPVDARMHLHVAQDRVAAAAEARAHDGVVDGFSDQELLRALAGLVVVVDDAVVGALVAVVFLGLAADRERGEQHLVLFARRHALVLAGVEHVEGIPGLHLALEIDVVGVDLDHVLDDGHRHLVAHRRLVDALVEPHAGAVVIVVVVAAGVGPGVSDGVHAGDVDRDVSAEIGQRRDRLDHGLVGDDDTVGLEPAAGARGRHQDAELLALLEAAVATARPERCGDRLDLVGVRAEIAQHAGDAVALLDHVDAFPVGIAAGDLLLGLGQQRDVFRHDARLETGIGIGGGRFGGVGHLDVGRAGRAGHVGCGIGERGVPHPAIAAPVGGIADPHQDVVERHHRGNLGLGQHRGKILRDEGDFRVGLDGFGIVGIVGGGLRIGADVGEQALGVERRDLRRQVARRHRQVARDADEGAHPHHVTVADAGDRRDAHDVARGRGFARRRQAVALV